MANSILVTGAAGRVGAVGRTVTGLLLKQGKAVRAMVRNEDERAQALRDMGAEVVVGNLLGSRFDAQSDCRLRDDVLRHVGFGCLSGRDGQCGGGGEASRREGVHQYVADDGVSGEHYRGYSEPAAQAALARRADAELVRSAGCARAADGVSRRFFLTLTPESVRESDQIRLPFGEGKTSPVAAEDVARVIAALLANPQPHIGKIYHLTGPQSENMHFFAREYSKAPGRTITFQDIPVQPWRNQVFQQGWPHPPANHLAAVGGLHRAGRYDRMSDDVRTLTRQGPPGGEEVVRNNAAAVSASAKSKQG